VKNFSFGDVDPEELLQRLTIYAYSLFGCFPDPTFEPVLKVHGVSPEDLSIATLTKFLDPDDHTVEWKASHGEPTMESMLAYLKQVLYHDFVDMKRSRLYKATLHMDTCSTDDGAGDHDMSLDDFIVHIETAEARVIRAQTRTSLLAYFEGQPDLHELLTIQLDPEGFQAYSNIELAALCSTSVSEIENRKKRLMNRLSKLQSNLQVPMKT
jgi:DNA-directed RNA polymerase specialized sigma24 family protein